MRGNALLHSDDLAPGVNRIPCLNLTSKLSIPQPRYYLLTMGHLKILYMYEQKVKRKNEQPILHQMQLIEATISW